MASRILRSLQETREPILPVWEVKPPVAVDTVLQDKMVKSPPRVEVNMPVIISAVQDRGTMEPIAGDQFLLTLQPPPSTGKWMIIDRNGETIKPTVCDKNDIFKHIPVLRWEMEVLCPFFSSDSCGILSKSSWIIAREKFMIVSLEFIRAIVTEEKVLFLDPKHYETSLFIENLKKILRAKRQSPPEEGLKDELPFASHFLVLAIGVVRTYLDKSIEEFLGEASAELAINVSTTKAKDMLVLRRDLDEWRKRVQNVGDSIKGLTEHLTRQSGASLTSDSSEKLNEFLQDYSIQLGKISNSLINGRNAFDNRDSADRFNLDILRNKLIQYGLALSVIGFVGMLLKVHYV